jgi:GTP pyrophosphokinase
LQLGRERLDLVLKAIGVQGISAIRDEDIAILRGAVSTEKAPFKKYHTLDDFYVAIGHEDMPVEAVVEQLLPHMQSRGDLLPLLIPSKQEHSQATLDGTEYSKNGNERNADAIQMELPTLAQAAIKLAHCCCPIPGDAIVGFLNPNKGMFVHRSDCRTLRRSREQAQERCVEVNWHQIEAQHYLAPITITAHDRAGLLRDVAAVVSDSGINMTAVSSNTNASLQKAVITATLEIEAVEQLERIFKRLRQVKNVVSVCRSLGRRIG